MLTKEQHAPPAVPSVGPAPRVDVSKKLPLTAVMRGPDSVILLGISTDGERRTLTTFAPTKLEASNASSGDADVLVRFDPSNTFRKLKALSTGFPAEKVVLCAETNGPESLRLEPFTNRIVPLAVVTVLGSKIRKGSVVLLTTFAPAKSTSVPPPALTTLFVALKSCPFVVIVSPGAPSTEIRSLVAFKTAA